MGSDLSGGGQGGAGGGSNGPGQADGSPTEGGLPAGAGDDLAAGAPEPLSRRFVAFASGRGGAGKSLLAANVAIYLAQLGKRVLALDADPAGGTLHHALGTRRPPRGYGDFLRKRARLAELVVDTPVAGVSLVAGEGAAFGGPTPRQSAKALLAAVGELDVEYVVADLGPPDSPLCLDLWVASDVPVAVTLPDPASIEATYRLVKSGFIRRLRSLRGLDRLAGSSAAPAPAALDLYRAAAQGDGPAARLAEEMASYHPRFIVNQTRALADLKLGAAMSGAAERRLGHLCEYLGHVESDEAVAVSARRHRPLVAEFPESKVAKNIEKIVRRLLAPDGDRSAPHVAPRVDGEPTHYEMLETEPGVSDEEIRRAYRRFREIYAEGSPAISGLYDEQELGELHARAAAAHDTLFAPDRRRAYDLSLPEADLARAVRTAAKLSLPRSAERHEHAEPPLDAAEEVTGAALRRVREARGLELGDVAQRTKISERHLRSIEDERFADMPAAVYVRGFVMTYARALRIDPARAAASYLRRFYQARPE